MWLLKLLGGWVLFTSRGSISSTYIYLRKNRVCMMSHSYLHSATLWGDLLCCHKVVLGILALGSLKYFLYGPLDAIFQDGAAYLKQDNYTVINTYCCATCSVPCLEICSRCLPAVRKVDMK